MKRIVVLAVALLSMSCNHVSCEGRVAVPMIIKKNGNPDSLKATVQPAPKDTNDGWVNRCVPRG